MGRCTQFQKIITNNNIISDILELSYQKDSKLTIVLYFEVCCVSKSTNTRYVVNSPSLVKVSLFVNISPF